MNRNLIIIISILVMAGLGYYSWSNQTEEADWTDQYVETLDEKPHEHGDFVVYIGTEKIDFSADKYQSTKESIKSASVHLHDNKGDVIHLHADGVSFKTFFASIGFNLTSECLETDNGESYCVDENNVLELYINGQLVADAPNYVINDEERVLLYYGPANPPGLQQYLNDITDEACMYSGTCPERGTPPPEECGLTCEL